VRGPAADHIDSFADWLHRHGYRPITIDTLLRSLAGWTDWMLAAGFTAQDGSLNLRGQVVEKGGKGLNFAASLKNDMTSHVFSVVLLDEDRHDYVRALRKAARDGNFLRFFMS
jgi:hypothetical protein